MVHDEESSGETPSRKARSQPEELGIMDLAREVRNLKRKMEEKDKQIVRTLMTAYPFIDEVRNYRTPPNFKLPKHPIYDGLGDPRDHVISYQAKM